MVVFFVFLEEAYDATRDIYGDFFGLSGKVCVEELRGYAEFFCDLGFRKGYFLDELTEVVIFFLVCVGRAFGFFRDFNGFESFFFEFFLDFLDSVFAGDFFLELMKCDFV